MPKTVTVEMTLRGDYEPIGTKLVEATDPDAYYAMTCGAVMLGKHLMRDSSPLLVLPVRPLPAEQTWERPAGLHPKWKWLLQDGGAGSETIALCSSRDEPAFHDPYFYRKGGDGKICRLPKGILDDIPSIEGLPPARLIWRIVERGQ